jgi:hypothetical protein
MTVLGDAAVPGAPLAAQLEKRCLLLPVDDHFLAIYDLLYLSDSFDPQTFQARITICIIDVPLRHYANRLLILLLRSRLIHVLLELLLLLCGWRRLLLILLRREVVHWVVAMREGLHIMGARRQILRPGIR